MLIIARVAERLGNEKNLSDRRSIFEHHVSPGGIFEGKASRDGEREIPGGNPPQHSRGAT